MRPTFMSQAQVMELFLGIDQIKESFVNPAVALGNFDGVHLGHQRILKRLREVAETIHGEALVVTFEPHPLKVLRPDRCPPLLTPLQTKIALIEQAGIEKILCLEFTKKFSELSPLEFVRNILVEKVKARRVIIGYNYHFGKGKKGNAETLKEICRTFQIEVEVVEALTIDKTPVSSSAIRELIQQGDVEKASQLLGRNYGIIGKVVEGSKRGHALGFPTANLRISDELYPKIGVYAVEIIWNKRRFKGVANIGRNPTFQVKGTESLTLEVYILNFNSEIYGDEIQVNFIRRIRDEVRFASASELVSQIQKDIEWANSNVFI